MKLTVLSCLVVVVLMIHAGDAAPRYQVLEPREGYVPVYIRVGDQPLADINPELAAAFQESVGRVSRSELAQALQADHGVADHSSSLVASNSHSASDEHKILLAGSAVKEAPQPAAEPAAKPAAEPVAEPTAA
uniref:Putative secreted peptide n=1 Tax=Anopheles braziliensis TaxID=58242 RepID=A0A2M3ZES4_9DIPT